MAYFRRAVELLIVSWHVVLFCIKLMSRNSLCSPPVCKIHTQSKSSHRAPIKRICHYLQGTKKRGLIFDLSKQLMIRCYIDADFAGQWNVESSGNPLYVKS